MNYQLFKMAMKQNSAVEEECNSKIPWLNELQEIIVSQINRTQRIFQTQLATQR